MVSLGVDSGGAWDARFGAGYDQVTGIGGPNVKELIAGLPLQHPVQCSRWVSKFGSRNPRQAVSLSCSKAHIPATLSYCRLNPTDRALPVRPSGGNYSSLSFFASWLAQYCIAALQTPPEFLTPAPARGGMRRGHRVSAPARFCFWGVAAAAFKLLARCGTP